MLIECSAMWPCHARELTIGLLAQDKSPQHMQWECWKRREDQASQIHRSTKRSMLYAA